MSTKSKPKATLAQRISGIQQMILADVRAAQHRLNQAVEAGDYTAIHNMLAHFQRIMEMRQLSEKLLELARADKATAPATSAPQPSSQPPTPARTKQAANRSSKKSDAKKATAKKLSVTPQTKTVPHDKPPLPVTTVPAKASVTTGSALPLSGENGTSEVSPTPTKRRGPIPTGLRTPERAFVLPILQTLAENGGQAEAAAVVEGVLERMRHQLKPSDFETTATSDQPRWKVSLYLARSTMVRQGLLRSDTPRGIWAISEQGERYLVERTSEVKLPTPGAQ